jgi:hypothetical protein
MLYSVLLGALVAIASWLIESALATGGRPRRQAWIIGIVLSVCLPLCLALLQPTPTPQSETAASIVTAVVAVRTGLATSLIPAATKSLLAAIPIDDLASACWVVASTTLVAFYGLSWWRLTRQARQWPTILVGSGTVSVARDVGPAVFGWWRPHVVFPRWLLAAPPGTQEMAWLHEREHLIARDPQLLTGATLLFALLPWNLPLLWMLRRLRFAMEVDCDARVVHGGIDPASYGEALLYVSQRQSTAPVASIALIEHRSQLERRINIMFASPRKYPALIVAVSLGLAASCLFAATRVDAPVNAAAAAPLKPPPSGKELGGLFEQLLLSKFPGLLEQDVNGTSVVVVLVNADRTIARAEKFVSPESIENVQADESTFAILGLDAKSVPYVGEMGMQSPGDPTKRILIAFTERATPGERFVSKLAPDNRAVDRAIFERYFSAAKKNGVAAGEKLWVLLDRAGNVLHSGQESIDPSEWNRALESRFPGIKTEFVTVTPITDPSGEPLKDRGGKDLQLHSVWLAPGSQLPST